MSKSASFSDWQKAALSENLIVEVPPVYGRRLVDRFSTLNDKVGVLQVMVDFCDALVQRGVSAFDGQDWGATCFCWQGQLRPDWQT